MKITPLFQLNLLLHMTMPYNNDLGIQPFFYKLGFSVKEIETTLPLPPKTIATLKSVGIDRNNTKPELVLTNKNTIILLECKSSDFDFDLSKRVTLQAISYFSMNNNHLVSYYGLPSKDIKESKIVYVLSNANNEKINNALTTTKKVVKNILGAALRYELLHIAVKENGVYIIFYDNMNNIDEEIIVVDSRITDSNELFYLIPTDIEGRFDKESEELLKMQVRNTIRSIIGRRINKNQHIVHIEDIAIKINPLFKLLPSKFQSKFKLWIKNSIRNILKEISTSNIVFLCDKNNLIIPAIPTEKDRKIILNKLLLQSFIPNSSFSDFNSIQLEFDF